MTCLLPSNKQASDKYDYILFLPGIWLCCGLSVTLRMVGPLFLAIPVGSCILFALLRGVMPPRALGLYLMFCVLIGSLSVFRVFPESWQQYFLPEAIIRQLIPVLGLFAVAWGSKAYFLRRIAEGAVFRGAPTVLLLGIVVAPMLTFAQGRGYEGDYSLYANLALWGAFLNNMLIVFFFLSYAIFFTSDWRRCAAVGFLLLVSVMSHFIQFKILTAITLLGLVGLPLRKVVIGAVVGFIAIYSVAINYVVELLHSDPNDGLRLYLITDVFRSVGDTFGLGIGYGTESVRRLYHFPGLPDFTFIADLNTVTHARMLELLSTGVHNSFAQALLRSGVLGCVLLIVVFLAAFPTRKLPDPVGNHAASLFAIMFIACFVNPALESPVQVVGIGFLYGYLLALNARARSGAVQICWSSSWRLARIAPLLLAVAPAPAAARVHPKPDIQFSEA